MHLLHSLKASVMVHITRRETFNAAHRLFRPEWSEEKNLAVFGKCSNPKWHGHNYVLYVTVKGQPDPETGFVMNLKDLGEIIRDHVIEKLDHKNMNLEVDFMQGRLASTENLAISIWEVLEQPLLEKGGQLHCVRVKETEKNQVAYFGKTSQIT
jgi:6-pyruvoyltetrahydropterin/6-carboxytetrahydropterin synthase